MSTQSKQLGGLVTNGKEKLEFQQESLADFNRNSSWLSACFGLVFYHSLPALPNKNP